MLRDLKHWSSHSTSSIGPTGIFSRTRTNIRTYDNAHELFTSSSSSMTPSIDAETWHGTARGDGTATWSVSA
jgi:hypothetical protein